MYMLKNNAKPEHCLKVSKVLEH